MPSLEEDRAAALCRHQVALAAAREFEHVELRAIDRHACANAVLAADRVNTAEMAEITARCRRNEYIR
jgi:hypothetical protein